MLAGLGFVPVVGELADGVDAVLYFVEGDTQGALLSAAAMVPFAGNVAGAAKAARLTDNAAGVVRGTKVTASSAGNASSGIRRTDFPHTTPNPRKTGPSGPSTGGATKSGSKALNASTREAPWAGWSLSRLSREGEVMYRVYGGGAGKAGSWITPINPLSSISARQGLALPDENAALFVSKVTLPSGVRMQVGTAGSAFGQPGGWPQVQLLERIPLSSFSKGVQLQ